MSNTRQIGLALTAHRTMYHRFPAGCFDTTRHERYGYIQYPPRDPHRELAWSVYILPFMEKDVLYQALDLDKPFNAPENEEAASTNVPIYLCPSAERDESVGGQIDYGGISGEQITRPGSPNIEAGVLIHDKKFGDRQIIDGLTTTLIVAEDTRGPNKTWIHGRNIFAQMWGVNDPQGEGDNEIRSDHRGGAVGLFADGHAAFLADTIDLPTLAAMITRAGREIYSYDGGE